MTMYHGGSRCSSPLPMIDPNLLLRPITAACSPALLTVVSPRHLHRISANASPSVNSWAGDDSSHHNHYYQQHSRQSHHNLHHHRRSGPILLSEPNMLMASQRIVAGADCQPMSNTIGVVLNNRGAPPSPCHLPPSLVHHHRNDDGFRKLSESSATGSNFPGQRRRWQEEEEATRGFSVQKSRVGRGGTREDEKEEMDQEEENNGSPEHFLDNPNIDELFLLGSVSQQNLVGKTPATVLSPLYVHKRPIAHKFYLSISHPTNTTPTVSLRLSLLCWCHHN